jgi:hypothetical protein
MSEDAKQPAPEPAAPADQPKVKEFSLKPVESQVLATMQQTHQAAFASVLAMLAQERFAYPVTQRTQFQLNPELTIIKIQELPEDVPVAGPPEAQPAAPQEPEAPKSGAVTA